MAGVGASHRLRREGVAHECFDRSGHAGGHTASHVDAHGFVWDEGPHISFTKHTHVEELLAEAVGGDYVASQVKVNNLWRGHWMKHPAQCNLHGLPTDLIAQIIEDMFRPRGEQAPPQNYEQWLVASFGRTFAELFPMQYGRKYHTCEAGNMSLDWLGPRLYQPSMKEVLLGALNPSTADVHYVSNFRYPGRGGFESYLKPFHREMTLHLNHDVVQVDPSARTLSFANGKQVQYDQLISSMPLPELIERIPAPPADVKAAAGLLACTTCLVVNVGVARRDLSDWHWTYFYDDDISFSRLSIPHLFSPQNAPEGTGSIQAEVYFSDKYKPLTGTEEEWERRVVDDLRRIGWIRPDDRILTTSTLNIKYANVIFDLDRARALATVHGYLEDVGITWCGRYGEWGYLWTDESFISGERAAERVLSRISSRV
jgi:protoporphyrinogen oxidase